MYYEETEIKGKLMYRTIPNGIWYECSNETMLMRIKELEDKIVQDRLDFLKLDDYIVNGFGDDERLTLSVVVGGFEYTKKVEF